MPKGNWLTYRWCNANHSYVSSVLNSILVRPLKNWTTTSCVMITQNWWNWDTQHWTGSNSSKSASNTVRIKTQGCASRVNRSEYMNLVSGCGCGSVPVILCLCWHYHCRVVCVIICYQKVCVPRRAYNGLNYYWLLAQWTYEYGQVIRSSGSERWFNGGKITLFDKHRTTGLCH